MNTVRIALVEHHHREVVAAVQNASRVGDRDAVTPPQFREAL